MSITREMLEEAIRPVNGRVPTLAEIGHAFGISRQRVEQLLKSRGVRKLRTTGPYSLRSCPTCSRHLVHFNSRCYHCRPCYTYAICGECKQEFRLGTWAWRARMRDNQGIRHTPRTTPLFCSRRCWGKWLGRNYGFIAHPENSGTGNKGRSKYGPGESHYTRKKTAGICVYGGCSLPADECRVLCATHRAVERTRYHARYYARQSLYLAVEASV